MHYELTMTSNTGERHFLFEITTQGGAGWVDLQLLATKDINSSNSTMTRYDPNETYSPSHYFGSPWKGRMMQHNGEKQLFLIGAFGDPGSRILLHEV